MSPLIRLCTVIGVAFLLVLSVALIADDADGHEIKCDAKPNRHEIRRTMLDHRAPLKMKLEVGDMFNRAAFQDLNERYIAQTKRILKRAHREFARLMAKYDRCIFRAYNHEEWHERQTMSGPEVVAQVFGAYGSQAISVVNCECPSWSVYCENGQYLGIFQMGATERATYGHGYTYWAQAEAAHRYFVASGSDWSPWACKP